MPCDHKIRVRLDERNFVVEYDATGKPLRIKERKNKELPVWGVYESSCWVASSHYLSPLYKRIIEAAAEKKNAAP